MSQEVLNAICRKSFDAFAARAFREVNPGIPYEWNWHIECLPYNTFIKTPHGDMRIGDLVESGYEGFVLSYNHLTEIPEWKKVTCRMKRAGKTVYKVVCNTGDVFYISGEHPIYAEGQYKKAEECRVGDKVLRLLHNEIQLFSGFQTKVLREEVFWKKQTNRKEPCVSKMRWRKDVSDKPMSPVLLKIKEEALSIPMRLLRNCIGKIPMQRARKKEFLQSQLYGVIQDRGKQSGLYRWWKSWVSLSHKRLQVGKEKSYFKRWWMFLVWLKSESHGCTPCGQGQDKQSNVESSCSLPSLSQCSEGIATRDIEVGECFIQEITKSLWIPEALYNIEVEDNNNYFANGILVHNCIAAHLQALYEGTLPDGKKRLCINVPPRTLKSFLASIAFPAWVIGQSASKKFITTSFNATLAKEMAQKSRILMESEWYREVFPNVVLDKTQNEKHNFWTTERGMYFSSAVQSCTGRGSDYVVLDDPINPKESYSPTIRENTNAEIRSTIPTRFNDQRYAKWLLIMQRLHDDDPTGHFALKDDRWYILKLPGENRTGKTITYSLGDRSWSMEPGELLFPSRLTREVLDSLLKDLLEYNYAGQVLQEPVPIGGGEFRAEWVQRYNPGALKPREMNIVILVDPAGGEDLNKKKKKSSDWTAMMVVGLGKDRNYYLLDAIRDRLNPTDRVNTLFMLHRKWLGLSGKSPKVGYERYGMVSDIHYLNMKKDSDTYHFPLIELGGNQMKEERIRKLIPDMQNGRWYFPHTLAYVDNEGRQFDLVRELTEAEMPTFPRARFDDMLDALSRIYEPELYLSFPAADVTMLQKELNRSQVSHHTSDSWEDF
jgi:predicted phage terminase large subunit-like protein